MKIFYSLIIAILFISFFSCKKDTTNTITNTNTVHDTVCIQPTKEEILTAKTWQIDELYRCYQGLVTHYLRGGVNTTGINYDNLKFTFVDGGTGTYIDEANISHTLSWNFLGSDFRNSNLVIGSPGPQNFTWNLIEINGNYLHSTTSAIISGEALMLTARYIQVP